MWPRSETKSGLHKLSTAIPPNPLFCNRGRAGYAVYWMTDSRQDAHAEKGVELTGPSQLRRSLKCTEQTILGEEKDQEYFSQWSLPPVWSPAFNGSAPGTHTLVWSPATMHQHWFTWAMPRRNDGVWLPRRGPGSRHSLCLALFGCLTLRGAGFHVARVLEWPHTLKSSMRRGTEA